MFTIDDDIKYKFALWQFDVLMSFNDKTQLVVNTDTGRFMIKKDMPQEEFEIHQKLSKIHSRNIVEVYDVVKNNNICTVLEQYIEGKTLEQLCEEKVMTEKEVKNIVLQLCDGLEILHSNNIIHRDLTPSNIMVSDDGIVKIIDFDISRSAKANAARDTRILGTEGFAAPEQFGFKQSTSQTDIYALGVLMNFMLTGGKLPHRQMYSGEMSKIIEKCIEIDAEKRYKNVKEISELLNGKITTDYSIIDKIFDSIPGIRNPKMSAKIWSTFGYLLIIFFAYICYNCFGKDFSHIVYITQVLILMFVIPIVFFSDFLSFQERLPILRNIRKSTKKLIFGFLAVMSIILSVILLPGMQ